MGKQLTLGFALTISLGTAAISTRLAWPKTLDGVNIELWIDTKNESSDDRVKRATDAGFDLVRLGVPLTSWRGGETRARVRVLESVRRAIDVARKSRMTVVVALFALPGPNGMRAGQILCDEGEERSVYREALADILEILPDDPSVAFEPLNEPPTGCSAVGIGAERGTDWESFQKEIYRSLLKSKKSTGFVVYAGSWGRLDGLLHFNPKEYASDPRVLFTFHYYEPLLYTHQGLVFGAPFYRYVSGLSWPFIELNWRRTRDIASEAIKAATPNEQVSNELLSSFDEYRSSGAMTHLANRFEQVSDWIKHYGIPPSRIFIGESGVARPTHGVEGPLAPGAGRYLQEVGSAAEEFGFRWAIWDLDGGFAILCDKAGHLAVCENISK